MTRRMKKLLLRTLVVLLVAGASASATSALAGEGWLGEPEVHARQREDVYGNLRSFAWVSLRYSYCNYNVCDTETPAQSWVVYDGPLDGLSYDPARGAVFYNGQVVKIVDKKRAAGLVREVTLKAGFRDGGFDHRGDTRRDIHFWSEAR
jgi:hypothetical protein